MTGTIGHNGGPPLIEDLTPPPIARLRDEIGRLERTALKAAEATTDSARRDRSPGTSRWRRADQIWMNDSIRAEERKEMAKRGPQIERLRRKLARLEQQRD